MTRQKSERVQNRIFSFMNPLAVEIWCYIGAAYVLVSLTIWLVARFSPFEWRPTGGAQPICGTTVHQQQQSHHDCMMEDIVGGGEALQRLLHDGAATEELCGTERGPDVCRHLSRSSDGNHDFLKTMLPLDCDVDDDFGLRNEDADNAELLCIENDFTLNNSFWFAIGTLMQQGSDLNPKVGNVHFLQELSSRQLYKK